MILLAYVRSLRTYYKWQTSIMISLNDKLICFSFSNYQYINTFFTLNRNIGSTPFRRTGEIFFFRRYLYDISIWRVEPWYNRSMSGDLVHQSWRGDSQMARKTSPLLTYPGWRYARLFDRKIDCQSTSMPRIP